MWLEKNHYSEINTALERRREEVLERVLYRILDKPSEASVNKMPTHCPACKKKLIRKAIPYVELFVKACPDHHGAWFSSEVATKLQSFIQEQMTRAGQKRYQLKIFKQFLISSLIFLGILATFSVGSEVINHLIYATSSRVIASKISPEFWPDRTERWLHPFGIEAASIDNPDEKGYLETVFILLENGISHRVNIGDALKVSHKPSEHYAAMFNFYKERQMILVSQLTLIEIPGRLKAFHDHLIKAIYAQINFYADYAANKMEKRSTNFKSMLEHVDLEITHGELMAAWNEVLRLYPDMDTTTQESIYHRLCALDLI